MLNKIFVCTLFLFTLSFSAFSQEESVEVLIKKGEGNTATNVLPNIELNGFRQAITKTLVDKNLDSEKFWEKLEEKKLSDDQEKEFLRPLFINPLFLSAKTLPTDTFEKSLFKYTIDQKKLEAMTAEFLSTLPDMSIKTFYILPEIIIDSEMNWSDVGVTKKENFVGVIVDSWKTWATNQFKQFPNVVILEKDFTTIPSTLNSESVTLKWTSRIKKTEVFQDRKSARFEMTAQYIIVDTKSGKNLLGFDFPTQKREFGISSAKDLSSGLASLVYNLLNSQAAKIGGILESSKSAGVHSVDIKITGKHGLFDITQINSYLTENFKNIALSSELKSYSTDSSVISIKSSATPESLYVLFAKDGGKMPLNEQKILSFSSTDHSFAIIPKEANN